jgi:zinc and cadmium transporter
LAAYGITKQYRMTPREIIMSAYGWLALYCGLVLLASLIGGYIPLHGKVTHSKLQFFLTGSAGVMLGASFFHVMPDAVESLSKTYFGWWMCLGVVGLFCIERFIAPHSHEINGKHDHHEHHSNEHNHGPHAEHAEKKELAPSAGGGHEPRPAAPAVAGWAAVLGLTLHTFMNGLGLAGEVQKDLSNGHAGLISLFGLAMPGLAIFIAIVVHKPFDALAISTVLSRKGVSRRKIYLVQVGFGLTVALGVVGFFLIGNALEEEGKKQLIGAALAFSAGTFLFVALSDLLPEVQFHRHDRVPLFLCLLGGVVLMAGIALLEPHDDESDHAHQKTELKAEQPHKDDHDKEASPAHP